MAARRVARLAARDPQGGHRAAAPSRFRPASGSCSTWSSSTAAKRVLHRGTPAPAGRLCHSGSMEQHRCGAAERLAQLCSDPVWSPNSGGEGAKGLERSRLVLTEEATFASSDPFHPSASGGLWAHASVGSSSSSSASSATTAGAEATRLSQAVAAPLAAAQWCYREHVASAARETVSLFAGGGSRRQCRQQRQQFRTAAVEARRQPAA